jgi:hypothetical protein
MSVIIPPDILPESGETIELVDDQTFVFSGQFSRRYTQRNSYGDPRWRMRRTYRALRASDRARLLTALNEAQGAYRIVYVSPAQNIRGSFPATELFTNADFAEGPTVGWSGYTDYTIQHVNGVRRAVSKGTSGNETGGVGGTSYPAFQDPTKTVYAPHVMRAFARPYGATEFPNSTRVYQFDSVQSFFASFPSEGGYALVLQVPISTGQSAGIEQAIGQAGTGIDIHFASYARCILADNGPNLFTYSDALTNADWIKNEATALTGFPGPDGANSAGRIVPTTVNANHFAYQTRTIPSSVADYCIAGAFKADGYTFVRLQMSLPAGSVFQFFNLATGDIGATANTGTGWNYRRAFIRRLGDGWFYCALVATKTNSNTTLEGLLVAQNADSTATFAGDGTFGVRVFRPALAKSGVPVRLTTTTASTVPSGTAQTGSAIHVKGLPASTNGLLLPGDWIEINQQLKMVTASLDSDAAGLGYLQFRPRLHRPVADNDPIIVTKPMGKFLLRDGAQWNNRYGLYMDIDLTLDEVYE